MQDALDKTFQELKEDNNKFSDRLQALELKVQRSSIGKAGAQEDKYG